MSSSTDLPEFAIRRADWALDQEALRSVRTRVFVQEQAVPEDLEWDGEDARAVHLLALDVDDRPIGTARLLPPGQIGRMAVVPEWRRRGVGRALIGEALRIAAREGHQTPFLNAQTSALSFYGRMGFVAEGDEFTEAGIPHRRMVLDETLERHPRNISHCILGETSGAIELHTQSALRAAGIHMASQAQRELRLLSHDLDPELYDTREFLEQIQRVAIHGREIPVSILLFDAEPAVRKGHRLIEAARHMTSRIQIRQVPTDFQRHTEAYLLADDKGYVLRRIAGSHEGTADFNAPLEVRHFLERFDRMWALGEIHQELRRLYL